MKGSQYTLAQMAQIVRDTVPYHGHKGRTVRQAQGVPIILSCAMQRKVE